MYCGIIPSLQHMTSAKIAIAVCNDPGVSDLMQHFDCSHEYKGKWKWTEEQWEQFQEKARETVSTLSLPTPLQKSLVGIIRPLIREVKQWREDHHQIWRPHVRFYWREDGTINRPKTAKALIRNGNLDITWRFVLACEYCLEDDVTSLWNQMSDAQKESIPLEDSIVDFWIHSLVGGSSVADMWFYDHMDSVLCSGSVSRNTSSQLFLIDKLTPELREEFLVNSAITFMVKERPVSMLFSLAQLDPERRDLFFQEMLDQVLVCFLEWPLQASFWDAAERTLSDLPPHGFREVVYFIRSEKIDKRWEDYNYETLLEDLVTQCPPHLKGSIDKCDYLKYGIKKTGVVNLGI